MLVLYRELAGYFVNNMNYLANEHNVSIDIVAYPVKSDAPFQFQWSDKVTLYSRKVCDLSGIQSLIDTNSYDLIFVGGWADEDYISIVKKNQRIPALLGFDKQWEGGIKDLARLLKLRLTVSPYFKYAFVPGELQVTFAKAIGFSSQQIFTGAYTCDTAFFKRIYEKRHAPNTRVKRFVYAGRYAPEKDIQRLWQVFKRLRKNHPEIELHCMGTGPLWEARDRSEGIFHHGFCQGEQLESIMLNGDVFILPSIYEPWGVVVNEFCVSGYPILLSDKIGARTALLSSNGSLFEAANDESMMVSMQEALSWSAEELAAYQQKSHQLGMALDEKQYAEAILQMAGAKS